MARTIATYEFFIDWDNDGGLDLGNFELGAESWAPDTAAGTTTAAVSATRSHLGDQSLLITWNNVANPKVEKDFTGLIAGRQYTYSAWVFVPTGNTAVRLGVQGITNSTASNVTNAWQKLSVTFTAGSTVPQTFDVNVNGTPTNGHQVYLDQVSVVGPGEDVAARVLGVQTTIQFKYGRDQARSLSAIQPGETSFDIDNRSKDYSPDNATSPLFGYIGPGRPLLIRATHQGKSYDMFRGYLDDFVIDPNRDNQVKCVHVTALDVLQRLADAKATTELWPSLQTGEAIHKTLDAIGWPTSKRDIDQGATTARWWWLEGENAFDAVKALVQSDGPSAFAYVSPAGNFVFRDRHHRLRKAASITSQATFRGGDTDPEPHFAIGQQSTGFNYDIGFRDLANDVTIQVDEREPGAFGQVWSTEDVMNIAGGDTLTLDVQTDEPFLNAAIPSINVDYSVLIGSVTVTLSRTSGQSTQILITASSTAVVQGMQLRATPVPIQRTYTINAQDEASIAANGLRSMDDLEIPWAGKNDAAAITAMVIGQRSTRLPVITFTVVNANDTRMFQILNRNLSDRITVVENDTSTNGDFFIEQIEQDIEQVGWNHYSLISAEKIRTQTSPAFTFDAVGNGFDQGRFGIDGIDSSSTVFKLGTSLLGTGLLGT